MYRRRRRFGTRTAAAVTQSTAVLKRKATCRHCNLEMAAGDTAIRLRLKKRFQVPCGTCGHLPTKLKWFHPACVPADINKAMGYDPNAAAQAHAQSVGQAVPPPPKPQTVQELSLIALDALEKTLIAKLSRDTNAWEVRNGKRVLKAEHEKSFSRFNGIKARVLRPGTAAEGETATSLALQQLVKLVYA